MSDFHVRQATLGDLDALVPLFDAYRVFYEMPSDPALARSFLHERLALRESVILLAADANREALGFTQLFPSFTSVGAARTLTLNDLYVSPAARRTGAGRLLLEAAADYGRAVGALRLELKTARDNLGAQALYESHGWVRDDVFFSYTLRL